MYPPSQMRNYRRFLLVGVLRYYRERPALYNIREQKVLMKKRSVTLKGVREYCVGPAKPLTV